MPDGLTDKVIPVFVREACSWLDETGRSQIPDQNVRELKALFNLDSDEADRLARLGQDIVESAWSQVLGVEVQEVLYA